ncbi:unnamed protein product [Larinioides sclopetarius]|uniref:Uncharacterized protein n=1 Tax=Larinioides sclopetarius TaxID=280406 RepID=A0AAV1ZJ83_9ARAC
MKIFLTKIGLPFLYVCCRKQFEDFMGMASLHSSDINNDVDIMKGKSEKKPIFFGNIFSLKYSFHVPKRRATK